MAAPVGLSGSSSATLEAAGYPGPLSDRRASAHPAGGCTHRSLITGFRPASNLSEAAPGRAAWLRLPLVGRFRRRAPTWRPATGDRSGSARFPSVRAAKARAQWRISANHPTSRNSTAQAAWQTSTSLISQYSRFVRVTGTLLALTDKCVLGAPPPRRSLLKNINVISSPCASNAPWTFSPVCLASMLPR